MDSERAGNRTGAPGPGKRPPRVPRWARLISRIPLPVWYALASLLAWLGEYVTPYRRKVINEQLRKCFPELDDEAIARVRRGFYRNFADVMVETVKALSISPQEVRRRMALSGAERVREHVRAGRSVIVATSHNCNWEWTLLILSLELGCPLEAAYKPMHDPWADRLLLAMRSRFGATMIAAKRLPIHVMRRRKEPRVLAMVADQDPVSSGARYFTSFFGQETAFYQGPEAMARAVGAPIFFVAVRRTARGHYAVDLEPLVGHDEQLADGAWVERYVRRVEQQIRANPPDWLWSYRRWKVSRDAQGNVSVQRPG